MTRQNTKLKLRPRAKKTRARNPRRLQSIDTGLVRRIRSLVSDVETNLDVPLPADDE